MTKRKPETSRELVVRTPRQTGLVRTLEETRLDHLPVPAQAVAAGPMTAGVMHTIQTTFRPDVTITVDDTEYQSLLKQGLVYSGNPIAPAADGNDLLFADKIQHGTATQAALKAALVPFWAPAETVTAGTVRMSPTGQTITRNANGTTRGSYDATEQAAWTAASGGGGGAVSSVAGRTGAIVLSTSDVSGLGSAASQPSSAFDAAGAAALRAPLLTPTATKTAAYTAVIGELAMMNVPGGATVLTLPTAPADKAQVGYRAIGAAAAVPLVITAGGTDTIGTAGVASASIPLADEIGILQYQAASTRWLAVSNVKTQASLDGRYVAADKSVTVTGFRRAAGRLAPALTVAATPPTVSYPSDTGQTSITGYRAISLNPSTAPVSVYGAAGFTLSGSGYAPTSLSASAGTANADNSHPNQRAALPLSLEFGFDGAVFEMQIINKGPGNYRIRVDDQYVTAVTPVAVASDGLWHLLTVDFTSAGGAKPRKIRIDLYNHELISLRVAQTATVWPSIPRGPRVVALGDSYTGGAGVEGSRGLSTWLAYAADYLGWDDYWNAGIGGTGIVATNSATYGGGPKFRDRLATDVFPYSPDVLIIAGGHNDTAGAALQTEAQALYTAARAGLPNAKIIAVGPFSQGAGVAAFAAIRANLVAAVAACPAGTVDQYVEPTSPAWFTGTGYAGNLKNDGNSDIYIKSDNVHPTEPGHVYLGYRMSQAIQSGMRG